MQREVVKSPEKICNDDLTFNVLGADTTATHLTHPTILPLSFPRGRPLKRFGQLDALENVHNNFKDTLKMPTNLGATPSKLEVTPIDTFHDKPVDQDPLMELKSDTKVYAKFIAPSISCFAMTGSMHSLSGGVLPQSWWSNLGKFGWGEKSFISTWRWHKDCQDYEGGACQVQGWVPWQLQVEEGSTKNTCRRCLCLVAACQK